MRLSNNKEEQTQSTEVSMYSTENDFSVYEISDKTLSAKVKTALNKGFQNNDILNNKFSSVIDLISYYQDFYKDKRSLKFQTSEFFGSKNITINFNRFVGFCEDVVGVGESALCYYSGELKEDKTDKTSVPLKNKNFVNPNDTYNTFINMDLYNEIIKEALKEGIAGKIYNKDSVKKGMSFDFTVASLKKYFNGLDDFENSEEFEAAIKINEFNSKYAKFSVSFKIGSKADAFVLDIVMDVDLKVVVTKSVRINLCSDGYQIMKIYVKTGNVSIINEIGLKKVMKESFDYVNDSVCLSDNGISLRDYYSIITNAYVQEEGVYLEGNQLYQ